MKIRNLSKSYGDKIVLDNVSFDVPKGKILSLIGPNGAGKSTAMHLMSRLLPKDSGKVLIDDKDISEFKSRDLAKRLAILTQSNNTAMKLNVFELVSFGRFPYSGARLNQDDIKIVNQAIEQMELENFRDNYLDELSGGQKQRAFIAMIIAQDTEYVLLDEPTNNLDIYHSIQTMKIAQKLSHEMGKTVIMVLHELNLAAFYSDYVCAFKGGKLIHSGETEQIMTAEILKEIYNVNFEILKIKNKNLSIYF